MSKQERRQAVSAYQVQLLLHRGLERLGIVLPRMIFRTSVDPSGTPFLKVEVDDGENLAAALGELPPSVFRSLEREGASDAEPDGGEPA